MLALDGSYGHDAVMLLTRREMPALAVNAVYIPIFTVVAISRGNAEFLLYSGVVIAALVWILLKQRTVRFSLEILWGLTIWGLMHMAGGNIRVGEGVLYGVQLLPVVLRYDQFVHCFGFGVATLVCHHLLQPYLRPDGGRWAVLAVLIVLMGCGIGAVNEIIEFLAVLIFPETGVGGYTNTMWDLVFNLLGGTLAVVFLTWRRSSAARAVSS